MKSQIRPKDQSACFPGTDVHSSFFVLPQQWCLCSSISHEGPIRVVSSEQLMCRLTVES